MTSLRTIFLLVLLLLPVACRQTNSEAEPGMLVSFADPLSSKGHMSLSTCSQFIEEGTSKYELAKDLEVLANGCTHYKAERTNEGLKIYGRDLYYDFVFTPAPQITCFDEYDARVECKRKVDED